MTTRTPVWVEQDYIFLRDNGNLLTVGQSGAATALGSLNTSTPIPNGSNFRLVVNIADTNNANSSNVTAWKLQFRVNAGAWTDVGAATAVKYVTSTYATDGGVPGARLNAISGSTTTAAWNEFDTNNVLTSRTWADNSTEYTFNLNLNSVNVGDTVNFRLVTTANVVPGTITFTPTATVTQGTVNLTLASNMPAYTAAIAMGAYTPPVSLTAQNISVTGAPSVSSPTLTESVAPYKWDSANKSVDTLLSNNDLTATNNTAVESWITTFARSNRKLPDTGKVYWRVQVHEETVMIGVASTAQTLTQGGSPIYHANTVAWSWGGEGVVKGDGDTSPGYYWDTPLGKANNDLVDFAFDMTARKGWIGKNGSFAAGQSPADGTNGFDLPSGDLYLFASIVNGDVAIKCSITLRAANDASGTAPSGYTWLDSLAGTLQAQNVSTGAASVSQPTLSQTQYLTPQNISTSAAAVSSGAISQKHAFTSQDISVTGAPGITQPAITVLVTYALTAQNIATGSTAVTLATIQQSHALTSQNVSTSAAQLGTATANKTVFFTPQDIATGAAVVTAAALSQTHALTATDTATSAAALATATIAQKHALTPSDLATGPPSIAAAAISQTQVLTAQAIATGSAAVSSPNISQLHALASQSLATGSAAISQPSLASGSEILAQSVATGAAAVSIPDFASVAFLAPTNLATGAPSITQATIGGTHYLAAQDIAAGSPSISTPTLSSLSEALGAQNISTAAAALSGASISQTHALASLAIEAGSPSIGTPTLAQRHALAPTGIATGAPAITSPAITARANLTAQGIATNGAAITTPAIGQRHALASANVATGAPAISVPTLALGSMLLAPETATGAPEVTLPALSVRPPLEALDVELGFPAISAPVAVIVRRLVSVSLATGAAVVDRPSANKTVSLESQAITNGPGSGVTVPALKIVFGFEAQGIAAGGFEISTPSAAEKHLLQSLGIATGAPSITGAAMAQDHRLVALNLATAAASVSKPQVIIPFDSLAFTVNWSGSVGQSEWIGKVEKNILSKGTAR